MLITTYAFDTSSSFTCWYAWLRSSFVNIFPPASVANRSSILGIGYVSNFAAWFTVRLKSPHIRIDFLSLFRRGTIGAAQSANCTGSRTLQRPTYPALPPLLLSLHRGLVVPYRRLVLPPDRHRFWPRTLEGSLGPLGRHCYTHPRNPEKSRTLN